MFIPKDTNNRYKSMHWRSQKMGTLGDAIKDWLQATNLQRSYLETSIAHRWEEIVGKVVASKTLKVEVREGVLYVEMSSAPLKHQMLMRKSMLIERVNEVAGEVIITEVYLM